MELVEESQKMKVLTNENRELNENLVNRRDNIRYH